MSGAGKQTAVMLPLRRGGRVIGVLTYLMVAHRLPTPAEQLRILPYNRVVKDLHNHPEADFLAAVEKNFHIHSGAPASPPQLYLT